MNISSVLDAVKNLVVEHRLNLSESVATITLHNGKVFTLLVAAAERYSIHLEGERQAMAFDSVDELKGWLRGVRTAHFWTLSERI
ncbi:hypothetical protein SEA_WEASELS2_278 [Rhodococcus phage Weasels2]|uniref:Uncharacterized protein n=1 Tax=Rhodococcus phage Weasels2 TaxID=1897437 RepID=A0A1I9SAQ0_9CAUD|nr:hypothetical protein FDH04_gp138 [Rhodococcus phage Weasels2]AOZ63856.1 hypothetical protein SEA_WEASELS2_278 [Rhodococcus phage Weasels2]